MATFINVHTHIFSVNHVPEFVVGQDRLPFGKVLAVDKLSRIHPGVIDAIGLTLKLVNRKKANRLTTFAKLGLATQQANQFETLRNYYEGLGHDFRFVVLPMDMEQMGAGRTTSNIYSQLHDLIELRRNDEIAYRMIPFVPVDPRRAEFRTGADVKNFVERYIVNYGFAGIKLYPALGYFPFDPKLFDMYAWAIEHRIPIMVHCIQGAIHWQGKMENYQSIIHAANENLPAGAPHFTEDQSWSKLEAKKKLTDRYTFQRNFTQPTNYEILVERLKTAGIPDAEKGLKICLGHFGMEDEVWFKQCIAITKKYENFFADISYVVGEKGCDSKLRLALEAKDELLQKTLFGTDFFVVSKAMKEDEILSRYLSNNYSFSPYADVNAKKYLESDFFKP